MRNWLILEVVSALLNDIDCRRFQFHMCVNQLYDEILRVVRPYYKGLYPDRRKMEVKVIETSFN